MAEEKEKLDVEGEPSDPSGSDKGKQVDPESDKEKNLAALRKKNEEILRENAELRSRLGKDGKSDEDRNLVDPEPEPEKKESKKEPSEVEKVVFDRDLKSAVKRWNAKNKVTAEEWAEIKKKVSLKGDELHDEIYDKIDEAYESLPTVKERKRKELIDQGRREAMKEFQDDELDLGGGGDVDLGGGGSETRLNSKEKKWANALGLTPDEQKGIDKDSDEYRGWKPLEKARK